MNACLQVSEQVWIPYNRIVRISRFGDTVTVTTDYGVEYFHGEDCKRIVLQLTAIL
jgi:hypothetical protein